MRARRLSSSIPVISFELCPAKTYLHAETGDVQLGRSVFNHCQIVGEVAKALMSHYAFAIDFPAGSHLVAACHDIGKVSPYFYEKLRQACHKNSLEKLPDITPEKESQWGGHAGVSQIAAQAMGVSPLLAEVLGQHHGFRPEVGSYSAEAEVFGGTGWQQEREKLVQALKETLNANWPIVSDPVQARLLAGLTSVADWIGSGAWFEDPQKDWRPFIQSALDDVGFVPPLIRHNLDFHKIFGFSPRPLQETLCQAISKPGVYVLEAPMGQGKTEAALFAAYQMLVSKQAMGIYFALPTQLTSNKVYERFSDFLEKILLPNCRHRRGLLLHGQAWLLDTEMGEEGRPGGAWFNQAKRGLLAPFAVGTIDQALMAAMNVKHGFVRAFGLAGKVVILDEVHSYDMYTGTILSELVKLLRQLNCTVIVLSATLTQRRREQLLDTSVKNHDYPLVSALAHQSHLVEISTEPPEKREINLKFLTKDEDAIEEALYRAQQGQQVLWVENTVAQAQHFYQILAARGKELNVQCGLLHSRFTLSHRQSNENKWVNLFGKENWQQRCSQGRILVGTQVVEQSLDIDADFLISRFAPTDMLLQRLGRLWRHQNTPRPKDARLEAWLLAPDLQAAIASPLQAFASTASVYSSYVLCRSLESWQCQSSICLPDNIRPLLEATYCDRNESGDMARWQYELEHGVQRGNYRQIGRQDLQRLAHGTLATAGNTQSDHHCATRYSEQDSIDVLLLTAIRYLPETQQTQLTLLDGSTCCFPTQRHQWPAAKWRKLTIRLMRELIQLRPSLAPPACQKAQLEKLGFQHLFYLGERQHEESFLRIGLVNECDKVNMPFEQMMENKYDHTYRDDLGYQVLKSS